MPRRTLAWGVASWASTTMRHCGAHGTEPNVRFICDGKFVVKFGHAGRAIAVYAVDDIWGLFEMESTVSSVALRFALCKIAEIGGCSTAARVLVKVVPGGTHRVYVAVIPIEHCEAVYQYISKYAQVSAPNAGDPLILTSWPMTVELKEPYLGYVRRPIRTIHVDSLNDQEIAEGQRWGGASVASSATNVVRSKAHPAQRPLPGPWG